MESGDPVIRRLRAEPVERLHEQLRESLHVLVTSDNRLSQEAVVTQLEVRQETDPLALLADLSEQAQGYVEASRAESTRATYASDWRIFRRWAAAAGLPHQIPVEPAVVAGWLAAQAPQRRHSTLARSLSAIKYMHAQQGLWSPTDHPQVRATLAGIKRQHPYAKRQATRTSSHLAL